MRRISYIQYKGRAFSTDHMTSVKHFQPADIQAALSTPISLAQTSHIVIGPVNHHQSPFDNEAIAQIAKDSWEPSHVLRVLHAMKNINSITVDLFHFSGTADSEESKPPHESNTSHPTEDPLSTFDNEHNDWEEPSLCTWSHPQLPKLLITHFPTWKALQACHRFRDDKPGWKTFVARNLHDPVYPAFDYTASFHSRDLCGPEKGGLDYGDAEFTDLLPMGSGWLYPFGLGSMQFARDMVNNMAYFSKAPEAWKPDLYERIMQRGSASSALPRTGLAPETAKIVMIG